VLWGLSSKKLKLDIELVPSTVWFSSVYDLLKEQNRMGEWHKIKEELFSKEGNQCWICGNSDKQLQAHEFWEYDDANHIQKLEAMHHLCTSCHRIKHIGFWLHTKDGLRKLKASGLTKEDLIDHFCKVNGCPVKDFRAHEEQAFTLWRERSRYKWKQDFGKWL
jgi:5-methylcytosine-specific restriction endonuclease McrA